MKIIEQVNNGLIVMQPPMKRIIYVNYDDDFIDYYDSAMSLDRAIGKYFLSMPYVFFKIPCYSKPKGFCWNESHDDFMSVGFATSKDPEIIYAPMLGNVDSSMHDLLVCLDEIKFTAKTQEELAAKVISQFWASEFNSEIDDCLLTYKIDKKFLDRWQNKSKKFLNWYPKKLKDGMSFLNFKNI